jgi:hypothetical protein
MSKIALDVADLSKNAGLKKITKNVVVGALALGVVAVIGTQVQKFRGASVVVDTK